MTSVHWFERTLASRAEPHQRLTRQRGLPSARGGRIPKPHPLEILDVASVKHCSILASPVVCSRLFESGPAVLKAKKKERKKEMYAMADDRANVDRGRAVEAALANIEKRFGKGSIMRLGEREVSDIPAISTTSLSLDAAVGVGGVPRGRIVEIYGPESSGKTTLALHIVAEAQKAGGVAAYIDAEHAMDADYAGKLGVDIDQLLISQPDSGEQALEIAEALVRSNGVDVIVVDSVAALVPRAELDGEMGDSLPGLQARLMSQALRKLTAIVAQSNTCFIFINQIREKIGVMFGNPETTTGGRALKFYSSLRLDIRRIGAIKDGDRVVGNRTKVKVAKNKVAPPFRECEFDIMYGEGISREGDLLDLAVINRAVEKSGAWFSYKGDRLGQGRENAKQSLKDNPEILKKIENEVRVTLGLPVREEPAPVNAKAATGDKK